MEHNNQLWLVTVLPVDNVCGYIIRLLHVTVRVFVSHSDNSIVHFFLSLKFQIMLQTAPFLLPLSFQNPSNIT